MVSDLRCIPCCIVGGHRVQADYRSTDTLLFKKLIIIRPGHTGCMRGRSHAFPLGAHVIRSEATLPVGLSIFHQSFMSICFYCYAESVDALLHTAEPWHLVEYITQLLFEEIQSNQKPPSAADTLPAVPPCATQPVWPRRYCLLTGWSLGTYHHYPTLTRVILAASWPQVTSWLSGVNWEYQHQ